MQLSQSIGVLDSGLGGLSVLQQIWMNLPLESTIYLADSKYAPYGNKPKDFLCHRSLELCKLLCEYNVKAIVVACNTATTNTISYLRDNIKHIPIIGVEPAIKPSIEISKNKIIGILATQNTLISHSLNDLIEYISLKFYNQYKLYPKFIKQAGNGLVELIESSDINMNNKELVDLCKLHINCLIAENVDTIVLGCTHYPFLLKILKQLYPTINFIETSHAIVNRLKNILLSENKLNLISANNNIKLKHYLLSSLNSEHLESFIQQNCLFDKELDYIYSTY